MCSNHLHLKNIWKETNDLCQYDIVNSPIHFMQRKKRKCCAKEYVRRMIISRCNYFFDSYKTDLSG